jgi:hypothetical protein
LIVKKNCFVKEKTEKKKATKQRMRLGKKTPNRMRNKRGVLCVGICVYAERFGSRASPLNLLAFAPFSYKTALRSIF